MQQFDEKACLSTDPFEGDFGCPGDTILKDKIGTARKGGKCFLCAQEIVPGERIRMRSEVFDGELMSFRWCSSCCSAMAISSEDGGVALEARVRLGDSPK